MRVAVGLGETVDEGLSVGVGVGDCVGVNVKVGQEVSDGKKRIGDGAGSVAVTITVSTGWTGSGLREIITL